MSHGEEKSSSWLTWPVRRPATTLTIAAAVAVLALLSAAELRPTTSLNAILASDDPAISALLRILDSFEVADELVVLVRQPDDAAVDSAALIGFAERFRDRLEADPEAGELFDGVRFRAGGAARRFADQVILPALPLYLDEPRLREFEKRLTPDGLRRQLARAERQVATPGAAGGAVIRRLRRDPLGFSDLLAASLGERFSGSRQGRGGALLSADGRALLVHVGGRLPASKIEFTHRFMAAVRRSADAAEPGHLRLEFAGAYPSAELSDHEIRGDMLRSAIGTVVLLQLLFLAVYRNPWSFPLAFLPVVLALLVGFGAFALRTSALSPLTAVVGAILAGLGVDYTIHYLSHFGSRRRRGDSLVEAADLRSGLGRALLAACVTSLIAFMAIGASRVAALRDFAFVGMVGLAAALVATLTVLPALLALAEKRQRRLRRRLDPSPLVDALRRHRGAALAVGLAILATATGVVLFAGDERRLIESEVAVMQPRPNPPLETRREIARRFTASRATMMVHLEGASAAELLALDHRLRERLDSEELRRLDVGGAFGLATLLPDPRHAEARRGRLGAIDPRRVVADFRAAVADSVFDPSAFAAFEADLATMLRPEPPDPAILEAFPELAGSLVPQRGGGAPQALTLVGLDEPITDRARRDRVIAALRGAIDDLEGVTLTGLGVVSHDLERAVRRDLIRLLLIAGGVVVLWLLIVFRDPLALGLAMVPPLFGGAVLVATMIVTGTGFNLLNLVALPLLAGIGVDDGVFLVNALDRRRLRYSDLAASFHAITLTSVTTALAFGSLLLTSTPAIRSLGLVLGVGIAAAWLGATLVLIPLLLACRTEPSEVAQSHP